MFRCIDENGMVWMRVCNKVEVTGVKMLFCVCNTGWSLWDAMMALCVGGLDRKFNN